MIAAHAITRQQIDITKTIARTCWCASWSSQAVSYNNCFVGPVILSVRASLHSPTVPPFLSTPWTRLCLRWFPGRPASSVPPSVRRDALPPAPAAERTVPPPALVADCLTPLGGGLLLAPATIPSPAAVPALGLQRLGLPTPSGPAALCPRHGSTRSTSSRPCPSKSRPAQPSPASSEPDEPTSPSAAEGRRLSRG